MPNSLNNGNSALLSLQPPLIDGLTVLGEELVVGTEIHVNYSLSVKQTPVATPMHLTVCTSMNLLVDVRSIDHAEILIGIRTKKLQHLIDSQALDSV